MPYFSTRVLLLFISLLIAAQSFIRIEKTSRDANLDLPSVAPTEEVSVSSTKSMSNKINDIEVTSDQISNYTTSIIDEENFAPPLFRLNDDAKLNFVDLKRISLVRPLFPLRNATSISREIEERTSSAITTKSVIQDGTSSTMFFINDNITITPLPLTSTQFSEDKSHDHERFAFEVGRKPNGTLLINFPPFETYGGIYKISFSSIDDPSSNTVNLNITHNPFEIRNLTPAREYIFKFYIFNENDGEKLVNSTRITIEPSRPKIYQNFINATTNSFNFALEYERISNHNLFYYSIINVDEEANVHDQNFTIDHSIKKRFVNYSIDNLKSGHVYNLSIKPYYNKIGGPALNLTYVTKPLPPTNVSMSNNDPDFILVHWSAPENSGLDGYRIEITIGNTFIQNETSENRIAFKTKKNFQMIPGLSYVIAVASVRKSELSNPVVRASTLPPLSPTNLSIAADFQNLRFIVSAYLADTDHSFQDSCFLRYSNSDDNQIPSVDENLDVKGILAIEEKFSNCIWPKLSLSPGNVYDFRLWTKSGSTRSEMATFSRMAVRPAFDYQKLGLSIFPGDAKIDIKWDKDRVDKIWPQIVGRDATLTVRLNNISEEVNPTLQSSLIVGNLIPGHCYPYMIYSLNSGLISREKFDSSLRTNPSNFVIQTLNVTSSSVHLAINPEPINSDSTIDSSCVLSFLLRSDAWESGHFQEYKRILPLKSEGISIENLNFLKPYTKYNVSGNIICGSVGSSCANSSLDIASLTFTTKEGTPGKLLWLHVTSLSSSVILVEWTEPSNKNGLILDYVITLESKFGVILETAPALESRHILHNTIGGTTYTVNVRARTAAGMGEYYCIMDKDGSCNNLTVTTQISVPPKPQGKVEIVTNAVQTTVFTITYNWTMFSTDNGPLIGYAIIVAEGEVPTEMGDNLTWFDVQKVNSVWPAYIAIYKPLPNERIFPSTPNYDVIGVNRPECSSIRYPNNNKNKMKRSDERKKDEIMKKGFESAENKRPYPNFVCNGPLKTGTKYRVKLRIYTSASLYADSDYSDLVVTHAIYNSNVGTAVGLTVFVFVLLALISGSLLFLRGTNRLEPLNNCLKRERRKFFGTATSESTSNYNSAPSSAATSCCFGGGGGGGGGSTIRHTLDCVDFLPSGSLGNRRQRSLRERTGIDGRLDRLNNCHPVAGSSLSTGHIPNSSGHHQSFQKFPLPRTVLPTSDHEISRPVKRSDFAEHVRIMSADSDFRFSEEFEDLKMVGRGQQCTAADLPCNRNKNRFTNILPFDHSRVKLVPVDDEEGSDYINASYIPAYYSPREFIATQGPLPSTRDDFWRMIVEQNCSAIVNLTRCYEKGREKCDQYWPLDNQPVCYGDVEVSILNETRFPDWTIRELRIRKANDQSMPVRTIKHFHFTSWPDFGVPEKPQLLVKFVRTFRQRNPPDARPIVVHCSAGVGRSGTFIALDRLMQQHLSSLTTTTTTTTETATAGGADRCCLSTVGDVCFDVFNIVYEMRKERVLMVQTELQYICIHQCLLYFLESKEFSNNLSSDCCSPYVFPRILDAVMLNDAAAAMADGISAEIHQNPAFEDDEGIAESGL